MVIRGYAEKQSGSTAVREVMSNGIETIDASTSIDEAAKRMANEQVRRLPVVENGELIGIVAIGDLAVKRNFC